MGPRRIAAHALALLALLAGLYAAARYDFLLFHTLAELFSIVIALGLAFFIDNLDHSIKSIAEAEDSLGLSVLANFPEIEKK